MNANFAEAIEQFPVGCTVDVKRMEGDDFQHDFTGHVVYHWKDREWITVKDQDGDAWDCVPSQLSHSSDEVMNEDS